MKFSVNVIFLLLIFPCWISCGESTPVDSILIQDVLLVDGTGKNPEKGALRIAGDKILELGDLSPKSGETVIDGKGQVLAPGFIDTHSHHDLSSMTDYRAALSQGITSIIIGQDGFSKFPIADLFKKIQDQPGTINVGSYIGHNTLRGKVLEEKYQRKAKAGEIEEMKQLLQKEMESGAFGLSSGLEYDPGIYSDENEVIELAKILKPLKGRYISHMRSEDMKLEAAIEEIIKIGREADIPVQISHMKLARKSLWGQAGKFIARLEKARGEGVEITADIYPYEYWQSTMTVLFPKRDFKNIETARHALTELTSPEGMIIAEFKAEPAYEGKTLAEIAKIRKEEPARSYLKLIAMAQKVPGESIIARSMSKEDIYTLLAWPHANLSSDGSPTGHPRGWGSFPRYFHQASGVSLAQKIEKMTSLAATHIGIHKRGKLAPGFYADLVLFDESQLKDNASFEDPAQVSEGILNVWVNGKSVYVDGKMTGEKPGRLLKR